MSAIRFDSVMSYMRKFSGALAVAFLSKAAFGAGGSVDYIARLISPILSQKLGQPVVIENMGGAAGAIGATRVANAKHDGYTLMLGSGSEVAIAWAVNPNLKYNGIKDLTAISLIGTSPMVLVGNATIAPKTLDELLHYSKANPNMLSLATAGVGTPQHLLLEYTNRRVGGAILHVPYRGAGAIMADVLGGRVDLSILTLTTALTQLESGKLRAYAVTGKQRASALPAVPTLEENASMKGADFSLWFGLLAPAGVPTPIVDQLNRELKEVLQDPRVRETLKSQGVDVVGSTPAEFTKFIKADSEKYQSIIKAGNISVR